VILLAWRLAEPDNPAMQALYRVATTTALRDAGPGLRSENSRLIGPTDPRSPCLVSEALVAASNDSSLHSRRS